MNERSKSRVVFHVNASIGYNDHTINGDVENLSTNGMFMNTREDIPLDAEVEVSIYLSGTTSELSLKINGTVVRKDAKGVGIQFKEIEFDSYLHLRNIVDFNSTSESKFINGSEGDL